MVIKEIYDYIDSFAPFDSQCEWDNSGLLIGNLNNEISKIGFALDATKETVLDAARNNCDLIITHHPIIFNPLKYVDTNSAVYLAIKNNINVLCAHTCLDKSEPGVNTVLAETLGLKNIKAFDTDTDVKMCHIGDINTVTAKELSNIISDKLSVPVTYADANKLISKVAVCGGAAGEYLYEAIANGADAFVTGEVKHHEFINAKELGLSIFCAGHFETENPVVPFLKEKIENKFKIECLILKQTPPTKFTGDNL